MKLTKIPRIYSVSRFNLGVLGALFGGLSQPKPPVATGLHSCQFKPQKFSIIFWRALVPPTLKKVPPPMILIYLYVYIYIYIA